MTIAERARAAHDAVCFVSHGRAGITGIEECRAYRAAVDAAAAERAATVAWLRRRGVLRAGAVAHATKVSERAPVDAAAALAELRSLAAKLDIISRRAPAADAEAAGIWFAVGAQIGKLAELLGGSAADVMRGDLRENVHSACGQPFRSCPCWVPPRDPDADSR